MGLPGIHGCIHAWSCSTARMSPAPSSCLFSSLLMVRLMREGRIAAEPCLATLAARCCVLWGFLQCISVSPGGTRWSWGLSTRTRQEPEAPLDGQARMKSEGKGAGSMDLASWPCC